MRAPIAVFYYPDFFLDYSTLIKSILLFDEIHIGDRPSLTFGPSSLNSTNIGNFGSIAAASPLRQYEASFRENGVPFYVHSFWGGRVEGESLNRVLADISDKNILRAFQNGLRASEPFQNVIVPKGNYGDGKTQVDIVKALAAAPLEELPSDDQCSLMVDDSIKPFDVSTPRGSLKTLLTDVALLSAKLNYAMDFSAKKGFTPLADSRVYSEFLSIGYGRAAKDLTAKYQQSTVVADLSFDIFREIVPEGIEKMSLMEAVRYRKESTAARESFLEYLATLEPKVNKLLPDGDYRRSISTLIETEVRPAAREYKNALDGIRDKLFGAITKDILGVAGATGAVQILGDLSWTDVLKISGIGGAMLAKAAVDGIVEKRKAKRECALSYLLDLSKTLI